MLFTAIEVVNLISCSSYNKVDVHTLKTHIKNKKTPKDICLFFTYKDKKL